MLVRWKFPQLPSQRPNENPGNIKEKIPPILSVDCSPTTVAAREWSNGSRLQLSPCELSITQQVGVHLLFPFLPELMYIWTPRHKDRGTLCICLGSLFGPKTYSKSWVKNSAQLFVNFPSLIWYWLISTAIRWSWPPWCERRASQTKPWFRWWRKSFRYRHRAIVSFPPVRSKTLRGGIVFWSDKSNRHLLLPHPSLCCGFWV